MRRFFAFFAGLLFGVGLLVSHMTSPDVVLGFLDVAGDWDPRLAFVMGGAVIAAFPFFRLAARRQRPALGTRYDDPGRTLIDARLVGGAALFGIGWGISGICPGPAVVDLALLPQATLPFALAMVAGAGAALWLHALKARTAGEPAVHGGRHAHS